MRRGGCLVDIFILWFEQRFTFRCYVAAPSSTPSPRRPMRRSAFIRRIFGTRQRDLKAFQYARRRRRRGGAADRGGGGPFQGRNFSVGSLEESIPPSWPSARVHPCLCPICVGFLVCSINDFSLGMKFSIFFLFQNPPTEFVSRMLFGTHRTPRQIDAPPLRLILGGGRGNHCAAVSCCQQSVDYRPLMTENE